MKEYIINSPKNGIQVVLLDDEDYKYIKENNIFLKQYPHIDLHGVDRDSAMMLTNDFVYSISSLKKEFIYEKENCL